MHVAVAKFALIKPSSFIFLLGTVKKLNHQTV